MKDEKQEERLDLMDVLLDETNTDPITLYDEKGKKLTFEQVAIIPYNEKVYAILKPVDEIEGIADDEAVVFLIDENEDGESILVVETDEDVAISVFDEYYNLLEEEQKKTTTKKSKK